MLQGKKQICYKSLTNNLFNKLVNCKIAFIQCFKHVLRCPHWQQHIYAKVRKSEDKSLKYENIMKTNVSAP